MASHFFFPIGGCLHICPLISSNGNVHSRNSWLPAQQQLLGIFFCPIVRNDYLSVQWRLSVDCLLPIIDILNHRTCGGGFWIWTTKGHPPNRGSDGVHVTPVTLSLTMRLVLTLEIPGVTTSPMGMVPMGTSRSTSTSSGICKQAVTPEKPCSRVGGHMSTNACAGKEGLGGVGVLGGEAGGFMGIIRESWLDPTFGLEALVGWGISPAATTGRDGCSTFSHPKNFSLLELAPAHSMPWDVCSRKGLWTLLLFLLGESHPLEDLFISEGEVPLHLLPQLQHTFH